MWAEPLKWKDRPRHWHAWQDKLAVPCEPVVVFKLDETNEGMELAIVADGDRLSIEFDGAECSHARHLTRLDAVNLSLALDAWLEGKPL